jgi:RNA polymerase sigma factor (sigma-70 family)
VDWGEIYDRLTADPNDEIGWAELLARARGWARTRLATMDTWVIDEVAGDTCSAAILKLSLAKGRETFATFVYGYFQNARRSYIRYRDDLARRTSIEELDLPAPSSYDPDEGHLAAIKRCLDSLPERDRQAVVMRYFEEASPSKIADELGVNDNYARRIVFNGLQRIRDCIEGRSSRRSVATP